MDRVTPWAPVGDKNLRALHSALLSRSSRQLPSLQKAYQPFKVYPGFSAIKADEKPVILS